MSVPALTLIAPTLTTSTATLRATTALAGNWRIVHRRHERLIGHGSLQLLADVGLVGFPNAGKSTLLSVVSAAKPEIADYPFTTLVPNLGIVSYHDDQSFVMADIPGIIEGAHQGKGLGVRFLRHIERNSMLLFLVPSDSDDIKKEYNILVDELRLYNPELLDKARVLAISKCDLLDEELTMEIEKELPDIPYVFISSIATNGLIELKDLLWSHLTEAN
ncbi:MAG: hypothetical protein COB05_09250 [Marinobacter sp.]|nr:MAG: hypothetical protein COB05_09250 [Marinobacter sp.]